MVRAAIMGLGLLALGSQDPNGQGTTVQTPARLPDEYVPTAKGPALGTMPILEAKEIYYQRKLIGRGVTLLMPKTAANQRYFYSRSTITSKELGNSTSTIESWSDRRGVPIRATYTAMTSSKTTVTNVFRRLNEVLVEETKTSGGEVAKKTWKIPLPKDLRFQFSQFHPMEVRDCAEGQPAEFSVVDPINGDAKRYRLTLKQSPEGLRYRLTAAGFTSDILTHPDGRLVRSETNAGLGLIAVEPNRVELEELDQKLRQQSS